MVSAEPDASVLPSGENARATPLRARGPQVVEQFGSRNQLEPVSRPAQDAFTRPATVQTVHWLVWAVWTVAQHATGSPTREPARQARKNAASASLIGRVTCLRSGEFPSCPLTLCGAYVDPPSVPERLTTRAAAFCRLPPRPPCPPWCAAPWRSTRAGWFRRPAGGVRGRRASALFASPG